MRYLMILLIVAFFGCNNSIGFKTNECKTYYHFVKANWIKKGPYQYGWKGDPDYYNTSIYETKYLLDSCLIGFTKKQLLSLFGEPTKEFNGVTYSVWTYCLEDSDNCFNREKNSNNEIVWILNDNIVTSFYTNPPFGHHGNNK